MRRHAVDIAVAGHNPQGIGFLDRRFERRQYFIPQRAGRYFDGGKVFSAGHLRVRHKVFGHRTDVGFY